MKPPQSLLEKLLGGATVEPINGHDVLFYARGHVGGSDELAWRSAAEAAIREGLERGWLEIGTNGLEDDAFPAPGTMQDWMEWIHRSWAPYNDVAAMWEQWWMQATPTGSEYAYAHQLV